jgi:hypothetical protein
MISEMTTGCDFAGSVTQKRHAIVTRKAREPFDIRIKCSGRTRVSWASYGEPEDGWTQRAEENRPAGLCGERGGKNDAILIMIRAIRQNLRDGTVESK